MVAHNMALNTDVRAYYSYSFETVSESDSGRLLDEFLSLPDRSQDAASARRDSAHRPVSGRWCEEIVREIELSFIPELVNKSSENGLFCSCVI
jgi:hypothetical protein